MPKVQPYTVKSRIDGKGVVIFTLESGGTNRDAGKKVFFSTHDGMAERAASLYCDSTLWENGIKVIL